MSGWLVPEPPLPSAAVPFTPALVAFAEEALTHARAGRINQLTQVLSELAKSGCPSSIVESQQKSDTKKG
jgi:hypothetical protein